jgi:hypothetical protein
MKILLLIALPLLVVIESLRTAPGGYEDEHGFHYLD